MTTASTPPGQLSLLDEPEPPRRRHEPLPGVVHVPDWLSPTRQRRLAAEFSRWAAPPAGLRRPRVRSGHQMSIESVCLGWHWVPNRYVTHAIDVDGEPVKAFPPGLVALAREAVAAAYGPDSVEAERYAPDAAIVNRYGPSAKLGLHQDDEEPSSAPVVTTSLGDHAVFRLAGVNRRVGPFVDLELRSGDLLVFGREYRRVFHGVPKILPATAPDDLGFGPGRLSITVRETGLARPAASRPR